MPKGIRRGSRRDLEGRLQSSRENVQDLRAKIRDARQDIRDWQQSITVERTLQDDLKRQLDVLKE